MRCRQPLLLSVLLTGLILALTTATHLRADAPAFDLAGPKVDLRVQRAGRTLPIAEVPYLLPGDRLWIHPDLPESQSTHFVLVVAFLRGSTNPPPMDWYRRVETWNRTVKEEGVFVVVPAEAEQALLFLAPETTGDFSTLRKAVHDSPGAFVRATQDLQQASWDRLRLDAYLAEVKAATSAESKDLREHTLLAARSLGIRQDLQCFDKPTEQQAPCLVQHTEGLVLDDSNAQSVVTQMASGATADMMSQLSNTPLAGAGQFSPYVGAVVDLAKILANLHTARYRYIPALALPQREQGDTLNLRLNVPPSFRDPKSVIVVALPPVGAVPAPQLHAPLAEGPASPASAQAAYCATRPGLALPSEGAPLVFASAMAHNLTLHMDTRAKLPPTEAKAEGAKLISTGNRSWAGGAAEDDSARNLAPSKDQSGIDVPVKVAPSEGGFVLAEPIPLLPEDEVVAQLRGQWGFDAWTGPKFRLRTPHPGGWSVPAVDLNALIIGRDDLLHVQGASTLCVSDVEATLPEPPERMTETGSGKPVKLTWKSARPNELELNLPMKTAAPGPVTLAIHQYGLAEPEAVTLKAYAEAAALDRFTLSAGDKLGILKGKRLDEVEAVDLAGITFAPSGLNRVQNFDQLELAATGITTTLEPGTNYLARVVLRDGRELRIPATVGAARPQLELVSKGTQHDQSDGESTAPPPFRLGSQNDLPLQRKLVFFLRSKVPAAFPRTEKVELAATDGSFQTTLSLSDGSLMLEDGHTAVAVVDPLARFGSSAFGPIQLRPVLADGTTGDWIPLGTLVRLPGFAPNALRCPHNPAKPCLLAGTNLFLITSVGATADMANAMDVPPELTATAIAVPNTGHAGGTATVFVRLRDDPETVHTLTLPVSAISNTGDAAAAQEALPITAPVVAPTTPQQR